jgi:hypothetical protein
VLQDAPTPTPPPAQDAPSSWAVPYVDRANELNLIPENFSGNFTQNTTRAEFAALAVQLYETVTGREIAIDRALAFTDTTDINVHKAATIGVVGGVGDGRFNPDGELTREQAAVMLSRLSDAIDNPFPMQAATFADNNSIASWAIEHVGRVQAAGIMGGTGNNMFSPQDPYTREQSIVTIVRLHDQINDFI